LGKAALENPATPFVAPRGSNVFCRLEKFAQQTMVIASSYRRLTDDANMCRRALSKSRVLSALQCEKQLFLQVQDRAFEREGRPVLAKYSGKAMQAFEWGNQVGELARQLFPGGKLIGHDKELHLAVRETQALLEDSLDVPLFEATFSHDGILVRADVFIKGSGGSRLVEVKASSSSKKHVNDCAIQAWVIENAGYPLDRIEVAHVDTSFVYQGNGNYDGLIKYEDKTEAVRKQIPKVPSWIRMAREALANGMPQKLVGPHCRNPHECAFLDHCTPTTEYPITKLPSPNSSTYALLSEGIEDIRNIPEGKLTNLLHERVRRVTVEGRPELDPGAAAYLRELPYPRYYLDFETISFVIPIWPGTRPYQALPFQWSCQIEDRPGQLRHPPAEFIDLTGGPPMRRLAEKLLATLGESGPIFMYTAYEEKRIKDLANMFPDLSDGLSKLVKRLVDLEPITRDHYYHPEMKGSWSLKSVLPTVAPDLDYSQLEEVQEGFGAVAAYIECTQPHTDVARKNELEKELKKYCEQDTYGMVEIVRYLSNGKGQL
jgi:hypothetical protein